MSTSGLDPSAPWPQDCVPMMTPSKTVLLISLALLLTCPQVVEAAEGQADSLVPKRLREPETPEDLYAAGLRQMKLGSWDEAIISFERVRNHFPFNQYSVLSELRVADCLYEKGSYLEAVDAYRQFVRLHPRHAEIDYVVYRAARSEFKLAPVVPQRDQTHTRRGLRRLNGFETRFPESEYGLEVGRLREKALLRLSKAAVQIGHFYWKQKEWAAAERRYRLAIEEFPSSSVIPRARYRRALCLWELGVESGEESERVRLQRDALGALRAVAVDYPATRWETKVQRFIEKNPLAEERSEEAPSEKTSGS